MDSQKAELELSVIKKIMEDSRNIALNNGWHYILWGVVVSCALIANYIMALLRVPNNYAGLMWFILMISTAIVAGLYEKRSDKKRPVKTFAGNLLGALWFAGGIAMFIFGFAGTVSGAYNPVYVCSVISTVLGVTYFVSGEIQQIKWLKWISLGWWAGAIFTFLFGSIHTLLIFALMLIFLQTLPGIILNRKYKKEMNQTVIAGA
jgi:hypothetical protein